MKPNIFIVPSLPARDYSRGAVPHAPIPDAPEEPGEGFHRNLNRSSQYSSGTNDLSIPTLQRSNIIRWSNEREPSAPWGPSRQPRYRQPSEWTTPGQPLATTRSLDDYQIVAHSSRRSACTPSFWFCALALPPSGTAIARAFSSTAAYSNLGLRPTTPEESYQ